ncbi:MAG: iron-sulfur cluster biosynthesis family protein [Rhodocyclaceae bacterium]|jgi:iron-sulfur cluster assembly protein|nr:iron-sulfur cluster biosynthesis family protein [Rhodocyclaceae bacterium]MDP2195102.1 iron-sulfur cluster biosynthesis family protein [Rhodocyclaceae bacterium]MDP3037840.1 iron-sulfur cluster biosynthesis family protein [Rhodocyclaceae bacterium]
MINLTPSAAEQIIHASTELDDPQELPCLRLAAKVEDGEIVYGMGFDEERESDVVHHVAGVTLLISPRSQELLKGATLDFVEFQPGEFKFIFVNPNEAPPTVGGCASRSSGCGSCGSNSGGNGSGGGGCG